MDLTSLRSLVRSLNFAAFGVDVTIESDPPGGFDSILARGIWLAPETEDQPAGLELRRRERTYSLAVPIVALPPHGAIVLAPLPPYEVPPAGTGPGVIYRWKVDGLAGVEADHTRLRLIFAPAVGP